MCFVVSITMKEKTTLFLTKAEWRNGSAADFESEGCGFESHLG